MPSKYFSHFSRRLVLTNGQFWYLRAQKVIFPQPLNLIFFFQKNVSAKFSKKKKMKGSSKLPADIEGILDGDAAWQVLPTISAGL